MESSVLCPKGSLTLDWASSVLPALFMYLCVPCGGWWLRMCSSGSQPRRCPWCSGVDLCPWKPWMALMDSHSRQSPEVHARQSFKVRDFLQCCGDRISCVGLVMSPLWASDSFSTKGRVGPVWACSFLKFGVLAQGSFFFFFFFSFLICFGVKSVNNVVIISGKQ